MTGWPARRCSTYWGSHGCSKEEGHVTAGDIVHRCDDGWEVCSELIQIGDEGAAAVRFMLTAGCEDSWWSDWTPSTWFGNEP